MLRLDYHLVLEEVLIPAFSQLLDKFAQLAELGLRTLLLVELLTQ